VKVTAAATALHDVLAYSICGVGEAILTTRPYYGRFEIDFGNKAGVKVVAADTDHENCFDESVVDALEQKLEESRMEGVRVRAVLIVNPHNPLGTPTISLIHHYYFHTDMSQVNATPAPPSWLSCASAPHTLYTSYPTKSTPYPSSLTLLTPTPLPLLRYSSSIPPALSIQISSTSHTASVKISAPRALKSAR
jgi:hypothetical protein